MKFEPIVPPRAFEVGPEAHKVTMFDVGRLEMESDEQTTLTTPAGSEYDVARKSWGFYATPSLNDRLPRHNLRPVLAANDADRFYILLVEQGHEKEFGEYLSSQNMRVILWLAETECCKKVEELLQKA